MEDFVPKYNCDKLICVIDLSNERCPVKQRSKFIHELYSGYTAQ